MLWNILRKLSLLHRRGVFEALFMVSTSFWVLMHTGITGTSPLQTFFVQVLMGIGAAVLGSIVYWIASFFVFGIRLLWAVLGVLKISIRARLGKVGSL